MYWLVDEPREKNLYAWNRNYVDTVKYLKLCRQVPGIKTTITMMSENQNGKDYTGMLQHMDLLQTHPAAKSRKLQQLALERGRPVLQFFNAGKNVNRYPFGFHLWARRAAGIWQWHFHYWVDAANPLMNITGWNWGVSNVVFLTPEGPVPTLWYELAREGVDDYRYLALLERLITKTGKGRPEAKRAAARARGRLEEMRASFPEVVPMKLSVGVDGLAYDDPILNRLPELREEVAAMIESLLSLE
jgi:hypothetical protein